MDQSDQEMLSDEENTSFRDSDINSEENSVDIISTDCGDEDFGKGPHGDTNVNKNKFSIESILGIGQKEVQCEDNNGNDNVDSDNYRTENVRKVKCIKPTPIPAAVRNTGGKLYVISALYSKSFIENP